MTVVGRASEKPKVSVRVVKKTTLSVTLDQETVENIVRRGVAAILGVSDDEWTKIDVSFDGLYDGSRADAHCRFERTEDSSD